MRTEQEGGQQGPPRLVVLGRWNRYPHEMREDRRTARRAERDGVAVGRKAEMKRSPCARRTATHSESRPTGNYLESTVKENVAAPEQCLVLFVLPAPGNRKTPKRVGKLSYDSEHKDGLCRAVFACPTGISCFAMRGWGFIRSIFLGCCSLRYPLIIDYRLSAHTTSFPWFWRIPTTDIEILTRQA